MNSGMLFREKGLSACEVASRGSGWHGHKKAAIECTSQGVWLLHSAKRDRNSFSRLAGAATSAASESSAHDTDAVMMDIERGDALFMFAGLSWCPR
jgi:hypothetical protein